MRIKSGYLYWADLGVARGPEPGKLRPVLVVQTDLLNNAKHRTTISLVCTTKIKGESMMRTSLPEGSAGIKRPSEILIDQIRAINSAAFVREIGVVPNVIMKDVRRKLATILS